MLAREGWAFIFKDVKNKKGICVEINGVFYESIKQAYRKLGESVKIIQEKCLSNKFPDYKIVPFQITYTEKRCIECRIIKPLFEFRISSGGRDGYRTDCKLCEIKKKKEHYGKRSVKDKRNKKLKEKRETDIAFKLNTDIATTMRRSLKGKKNGAPWETLVDYDTNELIKHLESLFTEGMTWENYGRGKYKWNLDHVVAIAKFNITSAECQEFKDCWALSNLQPLWETRNAEKGDKPMEPKYLIKPF